MPLTVGDHIAHYDVTALIGEGGMGRVYQAMRYQAQAPGGAQDIP